MPDRRSAPQPLDPAARRVADRVAVARERVGAAGGDPSSVRIVAVTKGFGPDAVAAALAAGIADVGENYAQELLDKRGAEARGPYAEEVRWHFLGAIQRNKVLALAPAVSCWQSVARLVEVEAIARRRPGVAVLVEVETTGSPGRNGCRPADVPALVAGLRGLDLDVRGLMTVAPRGEREATEAFRTVSHLADDLALPERSMGMSDDLELAVAEGATMVRLGRALFGDRPPRSSRR